MAWGGGIQAYNNKVRKDFVATGFKPFTSRVQLLAFAARCRADWNIERGTHKFFPFSCRVMVKGAKGVAQWITVIDLIMPDKGDHVSEPVLRIMGADKYADIREANELRSALRATCEARFTIAREAREARLAELDNMNLAELVSASHILPPTIEDEFRFVLRTSIDAMDLNQLIQLASFAENLATSLVSEGITQ